MFTLVFFKIIASLLNVGIGFTAGRITQVKVEHLSVLLFYFIGPIVFMSAPLRTEINVSTIGITLLVFVITTVSCLTSYVFLGKFYKNRERNLLSLTAGSSNCGFFMVPIVSAIFDESTFALYMMAVVGESLYESSIGFYMAIRNLTSAKDSLKRIFRLPAFNAFIIGVSLSLLGVKLPPFLGDFVKNMQSTFAVLGMTLVGVAVSQIRGLNLDLKFIGLALFLNLIYQPLIYYIFILGLKFFFGDVVETHCKVLFVFSLAPVAVNSIVISEIIGLSTEKAAAAVLLSALVSSIYLPLLLQFVL